MKKVNLLGMAVWVSVCLLGVICPVQAAFIGGDGDLVGVVTEESGYSHYRVTNNPADSYFAYFSVDLGSVENVSSFILTNRTDTATACGFNIDLFRIYTATDETVAGFDPTAKASYETLVYTSPYDAGNPGAVRTAALASVQNKQYFMFEVSSIHARWLGTWVTDVADFDSLVAVPEPGVLSLLAIGGLGLLRKRK